MVKRGRVNKTKISIKKELLFSRRLIKELQLIIPKEISLENIQGEKFVNGMRIYFLVKYFRSFRAMINLIENGFGEDSTIIARSLCEI